MGEGVKHEDGDDMSGTEENLRALLHQYAGKYGELRGILECMVHRDQRDGRGSDYFTSHAASVLESHRRDEERTFSPRAIAGVRSQLKAALNACHGK